MNNTHILERVLNGIFQPPANKINYALNNNQDGATTAKGQFRCIYFNNEHFIKLIETCLVHLQSTKKTKPHEFNKPQFEFIDVGCGCGQKVFLAEILGCSASGLDYYQEFVDAARKILGTVNVDERRWIDSGNKARLAERQKELKENIFQADATAFTDYSKYDIIYFYRPIADSLGQAKLEANVVNNAKVGALVLPVYSPEIFAGECFSRVSKLESLGWKRTSLKDDKGMPHSCFEKVAVTTEKVTINSLEDLHNFRAQNNS